MGDGSGGTCSPLSPSPFPVMTNMQYTLASRARSRAVQFAASRRRTRSRKGWNHPGEDPAVSPSWDRVLWLPRDRHGCVVCVYAWVAARERLVGLSGRTQRKQAMRHASRTTRAPLSTRADGQPKRFRSNPDPKDLLHQRPSRPSMRKRRKARRVRSSPVTFGREDNAPIKLG